ncbi:MAG: hypothetical protein AAGN82_09250 [Myxococcota bacterium]
MAKRSGRQRRWRRVLGGAAIGMPLVALAMWIAAHRVPGFGSFMADTLRSAFGNEFVAWLEDTAYGAQDWFNRKTKADAAPEPMWEVPATPMVPVSASGPATSSAPPSGPPPFVVADVGPMFEAVAAEGDGKWVPLVDPRAPRDRVRGYKMFVHPDRVRSWAVAAVLVFDLRTLELHAVAGKYEPKGKTPEAKNYPRPGTIPTADHQRLLAAFNGGYKATHGDYGMKVDGVVLLPPRPLSCVVGKVAATGDLLIRPWEAVSARAPELEWYRQTPICMYDEGTPHPALSVASVGWGAASVSKTTVIRRSAIGLDETGRRLFVGIGNHVTGRAIGEAMHHAGAHYVAQLDVNFSYPKFLLYAHGEAPGTLVPVPLTENFEFDPGHYVHTASHRDFFYLARRR